MKTLFPSVFALCASLLVTSQATAQLPAQPSLIPHGPPFFDFGAYAVQDQDLGSSDPALAKAYDNFSLTADYNIDGISWSGIYVEPLSASPSDTDFIIEIWGAPAGVPNLAGGALHTFVIEGGATVGTGGADLVVTGLLSHTSPATTTSVGGGPAFLYNAPLATTTLAAGDYWISVIADQRFDNLDPLVDPEWQWHLGTGPADGFYSYDRLFDAAPPGTLEIGSLQLGKDLAFELKGSIVPEPSGIVMALFVLSTVGFLGRKRK